MPSGRTIWVRMGQLLEMYSKRLNAGTGSTLIDFQVIGLLIGSRLEAMFKPLPSNAPTSKSATDLTEPILKGG